MNDPITRSTALRILRRAEHQSELTRATVTAIEENGPDGTCLLTINWRQRTPCSKKKAIGHFKAWLLTVGLEPDHLPKNEEGYGSYKSDTTPELYLRYLYAAENGEDDLPDD